jgi:hypothetical protein
MTGSQNVGERSAVAAARLAFLGAVTRGVHSAPDAEVSKWIALLPRLLWEESSDAALRSALSALGACSQRWRTTGSPSLLAALKSAANELVPFFFVPDGKRKRKARVGPVAKLSADEQLRAAQTLTALPCAPNVLINAIGKWITSTSESDAPPAHIAAMTIESLVLWNDANTISMSALLQVMLDALQPPVEVGWRRRISLARAVVNSLSCLQEPSECLLSMLEELSDASKLESRNDNIDSVQERRHLSGQLILSARVLQQKDFQMLDYTCASTIASATARYIACAYSQGAVQRFSRVYSNVTLAEDDPMEELAYDVVIAMRGKNSNAQLMRETRDQAWRLLSPIERNTGDAQTLLSALNLS